MTVNNAPTFAQRSAETRDPLLAQTGNAARGILRDLNRLPRSKRAQALNNVLRSYDPSLPAKVHKVANRLHAQGMPVNLAVERALALGLADSSIDRIRAIGAARMRGVSPAVAGLGYLGQTETPSETPAETSAKKRVGQMFQGIVCSDGVQTSVTDMVGRNKGADAHAATNLGYEVAQGFAQCASMNPQAPTPPPAPTPTPDSGGSMVFPIVLGGAALLVVGGAVWYTRKK